MRGSRAPAVLPGGSWLRPRPGPHAIFFCPCHSQGPPQWSNRCCSTHPKLSHPHPPPPTRLGFYRAEDDAARAYDMLACWRNRQLALEQAERLAQGSEPRSRRRRARGGGAARRPRRVGSEEDDEATESEAEGVRRPAKRRLMSQELPLNLPEDAPDGSAPILSGSLEDVLECVRGE